MKENNGIKELREKLGYSQIELAEKIHVNPSTVSRWESEPGRRISRLAQRQLARLERKLDYLELLGKEGRNDRL